jgi:hypothetical protein
VIETQFDIVIANRAETTAKTNQGRKKQKRCGFKHDVSRSIPAPKQIMLGRQNIKSRQPGGLAPRKRWRRVADKCLEEKTDKGVPNSWKFPALSLRKAGALS